MVLSKAFDYAVFAAVQIILTTSDVPAVKSQHLLLVFKTLLIIPYLKISIANESGKVVVNPAF